MGLMLHIFVVIGAIGLLVKALIGLSYFVSSVWEKEKRAATFAFVQFLIMTAVLIAYLYLMRAGFFETKTGFMVLIAGYIIALTAAYLLLRRTEPNQKALKGSQGFIAGTVKRHDERAIVFARNRSLPPGSEQYKTFYKLYPQYEHCDTRRRQLGGPLGHFGTIDSPHEGPNVAATMASAAIPAYLGAPEKVKPGPHFLMTKKTVKLTPEEATERVKGYARNRGADLVGITELNPLWVYSHRGEIFYGNWEDWGREIEVEHTYAVVFATEMSLEMVGTGPHSPTMIESMGNYAQGAYIATQLAQFIANLGYSATASHFRHYEALMVPLAVDAGLGELGRLGYLVTKEFGPRVRIGAVSTNLPLIPDKPVDIGVEDFCGICRKCARCCPSHSIPEGEEQTVVNGLHRWKLNEETCFEYWGKIGTDCNICMRVCPWSHARTLPHRIILWIIMRNRLGRRLFYIMDDIFYGRKPKVKEISRWASFH